MADKPSTDPDGKPAFVAGLPEGPLWRPLCYDGPLVCPFYGPDHPARSNEESTEAFNEDVARAAFGDEEIDLLQELQQYSSTFRGDWWILARLHAAIRTAQARDPGRTDRERFGAWTSDCRELRRAGVRAHLEHADLSRADLEHADFYLAHIEHADIRYAHLEHANLFEAHLEHANLRGTHLEHANLFEAHLEHANLRWAHLEHTDLGLAHLEHADLDGAHLDHGDIRGATGVLLGDNPAERLRIDGRARDPWSVLRRTYTGPRYALHLALTLAFLLPFAVSVSNLGAIDRAYTAIAEATPRPAFEPRLRELPRAGPRAVAEPRVENLAQGELRGLVERFDRHHAPTPAWWVLVGGLEAWYFAILTAVVAAYNAVRLVVMLGVWRWLTLGAENLSTAGVTALREAEERSRVTPWLEDYYGPLHPVSDEYRKHVLKWIADESGNLQPSEHEPGRAERLRREWLWMASCWLRYDKEFPLMAIGLYRLHCITRVLFWLAVAAFLFRAAHWVLTATVPAPIDALL